MNKALRVAWMVAGLLPVTAGMAQSLNTDQDDLAYPEEGVVKKSVIKKKAKAAKKDQGTWQFHVDRVAAEAGVFTDSDAPERAAYVHGAVSAKRQSGDWEFALGARLDGALQSDPNADQARLDYGDNYISWRDEDARVTVGTQTIAWGRVDEVSPVDRMSRMDVTRLILDEQSDRRRAVPAVRYERFMGDYKLDVVWMPLFDAAVMPHKQSAWHPVDTASGRLLGIGSVPLIVGSRIKTDRDGSGGGGLRLTRTAGDWDYGLSLQRVRQSLPYYRLGPGVLTEIHPYSWVAGTELETQQGGVTWRMELAWSSDVPVTTPLVELKFERAWDLVLGAEFFPGDADTRVTLQLASHETLADQSVLDRTEAHALVGEVEHPFAEGRWRFNVRFIAGLKDRDTYLNPKLSYLGIDQHEIFLAGHWFGGEDKTLGGYYKSRDLIELGWRAKF